MAFARNHFAMNTRQKDGATLRAHLTQAAKAGSKRAQEELAKAVVSPGPLGYLWSLFLELHNHRGSGGMGPSPITWPDLDAWQRLTRRTLAPWEFDLLGALDNVFFETALPKAGA